MRSARQPNCPSKTSLHESETDKNRHLLSTTRPVVSYVERMHSQQCPARLSPAFSSRAEAVHYSHVKQRIEISTEFDRQGPWRSAGRLHHGPDAHAAASQGDTAGTTRQNRH